MACVVQKRLSLSSLMKERLLHATDPYLSRDDISSLQLQIRLFKETKGKREASEERETLTKAKRAEKLYTLFVIRSTEERGEKTPVLQRRLS